MIYRSSFANQKGNHDKFPTLPDGKRDLIRDWNHVEAWQQMEKVVASGKAKAIGVCNVCPHVHDN